MLYYILAIMLFISMPASAQNAPAPAAVADKGILVRNIIMKGFVLDDRGQFTRLFKPYRDKYLTETDIDTILQKLDELYEEAGFEGLIAIAHDIKRNCLIFTVSLIK